MTWRKSAFVAAVCAIGFQAPASAQRLDVGDPFEDYLRVLQILGHADAGSFTVRPLRNDDMSVERSRPWLQDAGIQSPTDRVFQVIDPRLQTFVNSRFPLGRNDGAVWQGRGLTSALSLGAHVGWRWLTITVHPQLIRTANERFILAPVNLPGMPVQAYPWRVIDLPQRFGSEPFWTFDPGQSEVRLDNWGASVGISTANLWWGPGIRDAIIMSNNAPGIPHAFVGTDGRLDIGIGDLEARWIWGRLAQSDWFDPNVTESERFVTGIVASYSPEPLSGLTLGLTRIFYMLMPETGVPAGDYFGVFRGLRKRTLVTPENPLGLDPNDQLLSLFGRWVLPESGFEVYWEWARNDHSWEIRDFLLEPEHSQAYIIGFRKALELSGDRLLAIRTELTHLEADATFQVRGKGTYYEHGLATQGYTHRGQIIGAGVGPGGNAQSLAADLYAPWGKAGLYLERQVHDNDAYYTWAAANNQTYCCHDVSLHLGGNALVFVGEFDVGAGFIATREYNRYFFGQDLWNLNLSLSARWHP